MTALRSFTTVFSLNTSVQLICPLLRALITGGWLKVSDAHVAVMGCMLTLAGCSQLQERLEKSM